jgi:hypothetical protein
MIKLRFLLVLPLNVHDSLVLLSDDQLLCFFLDAAHAETANAHRNHKADYQSYEGYYPHTDGFLFNIQLFGAPF